MDIQKQIVVLEVSKDRQSEDQIDDTQYDQRILDFLRRGGLLGGRVVCVTSAKWMIPEIGVVCFELLTEHLLPGYPYLTRQQIVAGIKKASANTIGDNLLGSVSEFAIYVLRRVQHNIDHPFIRSFRAQDPLGRANFPLIDVLFFRPKKDPAKDRIYVQEIKATRDNPTYFHECQKDIEGLYAKSRLTSTAEHMKVGSETCKS